MPLETYQAPANVKFVNVGKTPAKEYLPTAIPIKHLSGKAKVVGNHTLNAIKAAFRGEEIAVVIPCGMEPLKPGSDILIEVINGAAFFRGHKE